MNGASGQRAAPLDLDRQVRKARDRHRGATVVASLARAFGLDRQDGAESAGTQAHR